MHLIVPSYASGSLNDAAEEEKQDAAWVKANCKPPTDFVLAALDRAVTAISEEFGSIRGRAYSLSALPTAYDLVLKIEEKARTEIFNYIEALKTEAARQILLIWQANVGGSVAEIESTLVSGPPKAAALSDEKLFPLGRPAPLTGIAGPPSPTRSPEVSSSPLVSTPNSRAHVVFADRRQKDAARAFIDSEWDSFSGFPAQEILKAINQLPIQPERKVKVGSLDSVAAEISSSALKDANTAIYWYMRTLAKQADVQILKICEDAKELFLS